MTITGGHTRHMGGEVDGIDGLRRMVRRLVGLGADYIKVMAAGGGTPGSLPQFPSFTTEELTVVVETAHDLGRKVSMHCIATESIDRAVTAGADMIEHAMFYGSGSRSAHRRSGRGASRSSRNSGHADTPGGAGSHRQPIAVG